MSGQLKIGEVLDKSANFLKSHGADSPRLDAELLLAHVLRTDRLRLYLNFDKPLDPDQESQYRELIVRRGRREPVAYLCGSREFMSLEFLVTPAVLIPRPETELLVEQALNWLARRADSESCEIFEVGAGSGAISIALAWHWRQCRSANGSAASAMPGDADVASANSPQRAELRITASDISAQALEVAAGNAQKHQVEQTIEWIEADLFGDKTGPFDLILSNPPYLDPADEQQLEPDVKNFEPRPALFAGRGGLNMIARLIAESPACLKPGGALFCEIGAGQAERARELAAENGNWLPVEFYTDLQQIPRVARLERLG